MFGLIFDAATLVVSTLLPTFLTYKALSLPTSQQTTNTLHPWLTYWITNSLLLSFPRILPFDSYLRLGAHIYLLVPGRAEAIYQSYLRPWLREHESQIEETIASAHSAGKERVFEIIYNIKEAILGTVLSGEGLRRHQEQQLARRRTEHAAQAQAQSVGYIQSLLGQFSSESRTQESMADARNAANGGATLATRLGGMFSAAATSALGQAHDPTPSASSAFGQHSSQASHSANTASIGDMRKSRSETDFERIEVDEARQAPAPTDAINKNAGAWGSWWSSSSSAAKPRSDHGTQGMSTGFDR